MLKKFPKLNQKIFALLIVIVASIPFAQRAYESIVFRINGINPITVDTEKIGDLMEGRIDQFSTSEYTFHRRLDQSSGNLQIDVFLPDGKLTPSKFSN